MRTHTILLLYLGMNTKLTIQSKDKQTIATMTVTETYVCVQVCVRVVERNILCHPAELHLTWTWNMNICISTYQRRLQSGQLTNQSFHRETTTIFTPMGKLASSVNWIPLTASLWTVEGSSSTHSEPTTARRETPHREARPDGAGPSYCGPTVLTTTPTSFPHGHDIYYNLAWQQYIHFTCLCWDRKDARKEKKATGLETTLNEDDGKKTWTKFVFFCCLIKWNVR